jgi:hypothetical protein
MKDFELIAVGSSELSTQAAGVTSDIWLFFNVGKRVSTSWR